MSPSSELFYMFFRQGGMNSDRTRLKLLSVKLKERLQERDLPIVTLDRLLDIKELTGDALVIAREIVESGILQIPPDPNFIMRQVAKDSR